MPGKETIYWDACIWIAHIKNEMDREDPLDMQGIREHINLLERGEIDIATSTVSIVEVLDTELTPDARGQFSNLLKRRNIHLIQVDRRIADMAADIRNYYRTEDDSQTISTPDAIHIASAVAFNCKTLFTFDGDGDKPKRFSLLPLDQPVAGKYSIPIEKPVPGQLALPDPPKKTRG